MKQAIRINPADNVAVALTDLKKGCAIDIEGQLVTLQTDVPAGHKFALRDIHDGENIIKYGFPIGRAIHDITTGSWLDHHDIKSNLKGELNYDDIHIDASHISASHISASLKNKEKSIKNTVSGSDSEHCNHKPQTSNLKPQSNKPQTFQGYLRSDGQVGVRNYLWVIPTVGCVNGIVHNIVEAVNVRTNYGEGVDAIVDFSHEYGCSQLGGDLENTRKILRDLVHHPNAGGVLVVGLGCENNQPKDFEKFLGDYDHDRVKFMVCQDVPGNEVKTGIKLLMDLYEKVRHDKRTEVPVSALRIGLKCGGSDGFSGITANPLLGAFSDWLCEEQGGTTILTEVPEMFGAETILMHRCINEEVLEQTKHLINNFKHYYLSHGQPVGENPSPGNKAGGISTLEEKALGCTQKSGSSPVCGVLSYGDRLKAKGLNLLSSPGNDLVAATALASAGCQIVLFTTGRGTPFATAVPTLKVSSNSRLYERKPDWIDFNAGPIAEDKHVSDLLPDFTRLVLDVASGKHVKAEEEGIYGIAIWKDGVTL